MLPCLAPQERRDGKSLLSREALLTDIERKGLLGLVPPEVKQLFVLLESEFNPLQLCKVVAPLLEKLLALNQGVSGEGPGWRVLAGERCRVGWSAGNRSCPTRPQARALCQATC